MSKIDMSLVKVANRDIYKNTISCAISNDICYKYKIQLIDKNDNLLYDSSTNIACISHTYNNTVERIVKGKQINVYIYYGNTTSLSLSNVVNCNNACQQGIYQLHANIIIIGLTFALDGMYEFKYVKHNVYNKDKNYIVYTLKVI